MEGRDQHIGLSLDFYIDVYFNATFLLVQTETKDALIVYFPLSKEFSESYNSEQGIQGKKKWKSCGKTGSDFFQPIPIIKKYYTYSRKIKVFFH